GEEKGERLVAAAAVRAERAVGPVGWRLRGAERNPPAGDRDGTADLGNVEAAGVECDAHHVADALNRHATVGSLRRGLDRLGVEPGELQAFGRRTPTPLQGADQCGRTEA